MFFCLSRNEKKNIKYFYIYLDFTLKGKEEIECDFRKKIKTQSQHRESAGRVSKLDHIDCMIYLPHKMKVYSLNATNLFNLP